MDTGDVGPSFRKRGREAGRRSGERRGSWKASLALRMLWDHQLASSGGTARQRLGLRENRTTDWGVRLRAASSAAFPGRHRMGKRQGTGETALQLETCPCRPAV